MEPGPKARAVAVVVLLAGIVALIVVTLGYSEKGRLFPLLTLSIAGALVLLQGVLVLAELRRGGRAGPHSTSTIRREGIVAGWIVMLGLIIFLLGIFWGTGLFLVSYLAATRACKPLPLLLLVSITMAALYGMFVMVLSARLPGGLLL